jgi:FtsP/CotA-like multicopper oxidase with cupredoxin domain
MQKENGKSSVPGPTLRWREGDTVTLSVTNCRDHHEPRDKGPVEFDREYIMLLTDWTDTDPETIFCNLEEQSDYYNYNRRTAGTFFSDARRKGLGRPNRLMWGA